MVFTPRGKENPVFIIFLILHPVGLKKNNNQNYLTAILQTTNIIFQGSGIYEKNGIQNDNKFRIHLKTVFFII